MKMDIAKYYDAIDHGRLMLLLSRRFKDRRLLKAFSDIIGSYETAPGKGLPIGNLTSQHFANHYLGPLDHYLLETLGVMGYVRYMDDMLVWGASRGELREALMRIGTYLGDELCLRLKDSTEIKPCAAGVNFLGFRIFPDRIRLGRRARRRFAEKLRRYEDNFHSGLWTESVLARRAGALVGFTLLADAGGFRRKVISDLGRRPQGSNRVIRGGSWNNDDAGNFRAANRNNNDPANRNDNNGFRACLARAQEAPRNGRAADQEGVPSLRKGVPGGRRGGRRSGAGSCGE